ncbi:MarR family transcriptional regulator [Marinobacter santoriniensis NKSG1]|uniref:MarR family transcriptional regulator n=1 Tax=Marinobacter santoriniensis NKSG1 TaxID=1288826 RepID=M7D0T7_9GAMM|nr:MarR family transcriptional regulator [Marinobacter santoriniensis]EMP54363.1 MarR family transcriptional regulator [Marinobacter santoriniensis NKSG1]
MLTLNPTNDSELGLQLAHAHRLWRAVISQTVAPLGLTPPRWTLLVVLRHLGEGATQKQLAEALSIELPSLTRTLCQLEDQGLIERQVREDDRRVREVRFTGEGRRVLSALDARANEARAQLLDGIPPEDRNHLRRMLERIETNACHCLKNG